MSATSRSIVLFFSAVVIGLLTFSFCAQKNRDFNPSDAALGQHTSSREEWMDGVKISTATYASELFPAYEKWKKKGFQIVLWMGASQLHAINEMHPDDRLAVFMANQEAMRRNAPFRFLQVSFPNANFYDLFSIYLDFTLHGHPPDIVVFAAFYDSLRRTGLSTPSAEELPVTFFKETDTGGRRELFQLIQQSQTHTQVKNEGPAAQASGGKGLQERLEAKVVHALEGVWPAFHHRGRLGARVEFEILQILKSRRSKRMAPRISDVTRLWNELGLQAFLSTIANDGITGAVYEAPIRQEDFDYHEPALYEQFQTKLNELTEQNRIHFRRLGKLIPEPQIWGLQNGDMPDFFHFKVEGHRRLARAIYDWVDQIRKAPRAFQ